MPKIHIIYDNDDIKSIVINVLDLLKINKGPITYNKPNIIEDGGNDEYYDYELDDLFAICADYRKKKNIKDNDFVILLTTKKNIKNWFSAPDLKNNIFIKANIWENLVENVRPEYPIVHEIMTNYLQSLMFPNHQNLLASAHITPVGCVNDFCGNMTDVIHKFQEGNVCHDCCEKIKQTFSAFPWVLDQINSTLQSARLPFTRMSGILNSIEPSSLKIDGIKKIKFPEFNDLALSLTPIDKVLYILVLKSEEGLKKASIPDRKQEVMDTYHKYNDSGNDQRAINETVDHFCLPFGDLIIDAKGRVNKMIKKVLGERMANHYLIKLDRATDLYSISLPHRMRVID